MMLRTVLTLIAISFIFFSCDLETGMDENGDTEESSKVFILNEGQFGNSNAEITAYEPQTGEINPQYFNQVNDRQLGDVGQSMTVIDDELFIVVNNSHRIEVVDPNSLELQGSIEIQKEASPRVIADRGNGEALVANLFSDSLAVVDLNSYEQTGWINVENGSDNIAVDGDHALIHQNEYNFETERVENWIIHFDLEQEETLNTLEFDGEPVAFATDAEGYVWVKVSNEESPYLSVRDVTGGEEADRFDLPAMVSSIAFDEDGGRLFAATYQGIMILDTESGEIIDESFVEADGLSTIGFDHITREYVLAASAPDFETRDDVFVFDTEGNAVDTLQAGYNPRAFHFSE